MKLYSLLNENHVMIGREVDSLVAALRTMLLAFGDAIDPDDVNGLVEELMARERQHPTVIADHVCLPHMRLEGLDRFLVGLMVLAQPVEHVVEDLPPVAMIFMILAPQDKNTMMLQTMAAVARLLKSKKVVQAMLGVRTSSRLLRLIEESGIDVKKNLVASDVMAPVKHSVTSDTILAKAVDVLVEAPDEGIPVLDGQGKLVGELTSRELLTLGMPKYLDLIANPEMLNAFEPFESFFQHENNMMVREVCRRDIVTVEPATPVVQVTHLMITSHKRRVYVVEEGALKGVVYRKTIVARVLHF
jgi:PTS system nitrogen regulatory IIA component